MGHVILLVVLSLEKQDSLMMPTTIVHARQHSNGLLRTADAPENVTKLLMPFLMKVQMRILANVS